MKKINIKNNTNELFLNLIIQENNERNTKRFFTKFGVFFIACLFASIITIFADSNPDANDPENDNITECQYINTDCSGAFTDVVREVDPTGGSYTTVFGTAGESKCKTNGHSDCANTPHSPNAEPASISLQYVGTFPVTVSCDSCDFIGNYNVIVKPKACVIIINLPEKLPEDGEAYPIEKTFSTTSTFNCTTCGIEEKEGVTCSKDELGGGPAHYEEKNLTWTAACSNGTKQEKKDFDFWVYDIASIEAEGCDHIGDDTDTDKTRYYATSVADANMSVNVILNPSETPKEKVYISWNGGNSVANDKLKITQSKKMKNEGSFTISASVSAESYSWSTGNLSSNSGSIQSQSKETKKVVKLYVFDKKPVKDMEVVFEPSNEVKRDDSIATGVFGLALRPETFNKERKTIYYNNNNLVLTYGSITNIGRKYGVNSCGRNNWPQPTIVIITETMKRQAKLDLTPNINGIPPRTKYWSELLTIRHEKFHLDDWPKYYKPAISAEFTEISQSCPPASQPLELSNLKNIKMSAIENILSSLFNIKIQAAYIVALKNYIGVESYQETRAYNDGKPFYKTLADEIK